MANTFTLNGSATLTLDNARVVGNLGNTITLSGSNGAFLSANIATSSWTGLDTSSLSDFRYGWFYNNNDTASIAIATGSAGANVLFRLQPYDVAVISWTGSVLPLYASATSGPTGSVVLQYILTES
jgi:hypothetical protein